MRAEGSRQPGSAAAPTSASRSHPGSCHDASVLWERRRGDARSGRGMPGRCPGGGGGRGSLLVAAPAVAAGACPRGGAPRAPSPHKRVFPYRCPLLKICLLWETYTFPVPLWYESTGSDAQFSFQGFPLQPGRRAIFTPSNRRSQVGVQKGWPRPPALTSTGRVSSREPVGADASDQQGHRRAGSDGPPAHYGL